VDAETVADGLNFGVGGNSWNGDLGVLGGLRGSSAVCDEPFTIMLFRAGGLMVREGWPM
jgi:hypothetical protein